MYAPVCFAQLIKGLSSVARYESPITSFNCALDSAHQDQNKHNDNHQTQAAAWIVAPA
jgi:hypothetical protein